MAFSAPEDIARELDSTPGIAALRVACEGTRAFLVGGAVRDLLSGRPRGELDIAIDGDVGEIARRLGGAEVSHERFGTAALTLEGVRVDLARTRSESYPKPGALPEVEPASIDADLARRDFTVNAMAIPLGSDPQLLDPFNGHTDLEAGLLRVLHDRSFVDDPTRALRAARYVARLGMELEDRTGQLAARSDLSTVSADRANAELARLAFEPEPARGFALLAELGLAGIGGQGPGRVAAVSEILSEEPWAGFVDLGRAILAASRGDTAAARRLAEAEVASPAQATELAASVPAEQIPLARALGADWLDRWLEEWRHVTLEISGDDLLAAGVEPGPAIGRGLAAALRAKIDGEISGRDAELEVALEAAAGSS